MTRTEQRRFVRAYLATFRDEIERHIDANRLPADWDGFELRWLVADLTHRERAFPLGEDNGRRRFRAYRRARGVLA